MKNNLKTKIEYCGLNYNSEVRKIGIINAVFVLATVAVFLFLKDIPRRIEFSPLNLNPSFVIHLVSTCAIAGNIMQSETKDRSSVPMLFHVSPRGIAIKNHRNVIPKESAR